MLAELELAHNIASGDFLTPVLENLFQIHDQESLGVQHLKVMQPQDGQQPDRDGDGQGPPGRGRGNDTDRRGPSRRQRGRGRLLECRGPRDVSAECMNAYYYKLSENNEWEWVIALVKTWWSMAWLAIMGPILIPWSFLFGWIVLLFPETKPDIDRPLDNPRSRPLTTAWYIFMASTAMTAEPGLFFLTQLLTWGDSDLRDFAIIYMDSEETFMYFQIVGIYLAMMYIPSLIWFVCTWWIYGIGFLWRMIKVIFNIGDNDGRRGGRRGRGRGGRGGDDSDDDGDDSGNDSD